MPEPLPATMGDFVAKLKSDGGVAAWPVQGRGVPIPMELAGSAFPSLPVQRVEIGEDLYSAYGRAMRACGQAASKTQRGVILTGYEASALSIMMGLFTMGIAYRGAYPFIPSTWGEVDRARKLGGELAPTSGTLLVDPFSAQVPGDERPTDRAVVLATRKVLRDLKSPSTTLQEGLIYYRTSEPGAKIPTITSAGGGSVATGMEGLGGWPLIAAGGLLASAIVAGVYICADAWRDKETHAIDADHARAIAELGVTQAISTFRINKEAETGVAISPTPLELAYAEKLKREPGKADSFGSRLTDAAVGVGVAAGVTGLVVVGSRLLAAKKKAE